jgi:beta-lactam-binding protein with PASTA domain
MRIEGSGVRVLAQDPPAGTAAARGEAITVRLSATVDSVATAMPVLTGLSVREALRRLAQLSVRARVDGSGIVVAQDPAAGTPLPIRGACRLRCAPGLAEVAARDPGPS